MLKKTITFKDLDGNDVTEDFYFHLTKPELMEMEVSTPGGFSEKLKFIMLTEDAGAVINVFKQIVTKAIGRRSADNRRFEKSEEITNAFMQTDAYSVLLFGFVKDAESAVEFIKGIMPADMHDKAAVEAAIADAKKTVEEAALLKSDSTVEKVAVNRKMLAEYTDEELVDMSYDELQQLMKANKGSVPKKVLLLAMQKAND